MGARRKGRSSIVVAGREFLWNFDDSTSDLLVVSVDKRVVMRYRWAWAAGGVPATLAVLGPEFPGLPDRPRPVLLNLPSFEHCYSLKGHVRRTIEWSLWPEHPIVVAEADKAGPPSPALFDKVPDRRLPLCPT